MMSKEDATAQLTYSFFKRSCQLFRTLRDKMYAWPHLAWLVLVVSAFNVICIGGKRRAFGIFIAALHSAYNETSITELNWVGDSYASLGFFIMPFVTTAIIRLNRPYRMTMLLAGIAIFSSCVTSAKVQEPGYLFLTHTLLHGVGSTLVLCGTSLVTGDYFDKTHKFHVLATAFVSGGPYGVLIFGPLFSHWIQHYGWRMAFIYSGILFLFVTCLGAITFVPRHVIEYTQATWLEEANEPFSLESKSDRRKSSIAPPSMMKDLPKASDGRGWAFCSWGHIKQNPQVLLWGFERLLHNIVIYGILMNLTSYVSQALNNEIIRGARVNLYFGLGESLVFTVGALIGDKIRGHLVFVYLIGAAFAAAFLIIENRSYTNITVVYVLSGFTGASVGVGNTFLYATAEEVMLVHGSIAFPMTKMLAGIGMLIAPAFSGAIIDSFGYEAFFVSMAVLVSVRVGLLILIWLILRKKNKKAMKELDQLAEEDKRNVQTTCTQSVSARNVGYSFHKTFQSMSSKVDNDRATVNPAPFVKEMSTVPQQSSQEHYIP